MLEDENLRQKALSMSESDLQILCMNRMGNIYENQVVLEAYVTAKKTLYASDFYKIAMDAINLGHEAFAAVSDQPLKAIMMTIELSSRMNRLNLEHFRDIVEIGEKTKIRLDSGREKAHKGSNWEVEERHFLWQKEVNTLMNSDKSISYRQASIVVGKRFGVSDRNVRRYTKPPRQK